MPPASPVIAAPPRITDDLFCDTLRRAASPAADAGPTLYATCVARGVDPAVALAFFCHESTYGTRGAARLTRNWGNLRRGPRAYQVAPVAGSSGAFAWYHSWVDGLADFCDLLRGPRYEGAGLATVAQVVPVYAPSTDGNAPARYVSAVEALVAGWSKADPWASWGQAHPLPPEQRGYAVPRAWQAAQPPLGPATSPEWGDGRQAVRFFEHGAVVWLGGDETRIVRR